MQKNNNRSITMLIFLSILCSQALILLVNGQASGSVGAVENQSENCLATLDEINAVADTEAQPGIFTSDYNFLMELTDTHRIFYQVDKIVACLSSDGQMIRGLQLGIGGYQRADSDQIERKIDAESLNDLKLDFLGVH